MMFYLAWVQRLGGFALIGAFLLTFWRGRPVYVFSAGLYGIGTLINIGLNAWGWWVAIWLAYGLSDSGDPGVPRAAFLIPLLPLGYAIASVVLLWPGISQLKALRVGKVLHLVILPVMALVLFAGAFQNSSGDVFSEMRWLVYGPLWFRVRELRS